MLEWLLISQHNDPIRELYLFQVKKRLKLNESLAAGQLPIQQSIGGEMMVEKLFYSQGKPIKKLGFGFMRLPTLADGSIDMRQVQEMVDLYLSRGFCYFDTAFGYHKQKSEAALRDALVRRYPRQNYLLATKLPAWKHTVRSADDAKAMFYTQMERLQSEWIDYYLFQNMGENRTAAFDQFHLWDFIADLKRQGLIHHFGVSVHDKADHVDFLLQEHPEIEFVQLQINFADWEDPAVQSRKCYEVAQTHGKPIVIMEPVKGGVLATLPPQAQAVFDQASITQSNAAWALRFAASLEQARVVLSGMSNIQQMKENLDLFDSMTAISEEEYTLLNRVQTVLSQIRYVSCTGCRYCCEDCPGKVKIPKIMTALNFQNVYNNRHMAEHYYFSNVFLEGNAGKCLECGQCESVCPQHLPIRKLLKEAVELFGE